MSMTTTNLQEMLNLAINKAKANAIPVATISATLSTLVTALGADTTTHSREVEQPPAALLPDLGN